MTAHTEIHGQGVLCPIGATGAALSVNAPITASLSRACVLRPTFPGGFPCPPDNAAGAFYAEASNG